MKQLIALAISILSLNLSAAVHLGTYQDWHAWQDYDENGVYCFVSSSPIMSSPSVDGVSENSLLISLDRDSNSYDIWMTEVSHRIDPELEIIADIDGKEYDLVAQESYAWLSPEESIDRVVSDMKAGVVLKVKNTSTNGVVTTDTYSLAGVTDSLKMISSTCN